MSEFAPIMTSKEISVAPVNNEAAPAIPNAIEAEKPVDSIAEKLKETENSFEQTISDLDEDTKLAMLEALKNHLDEAPDGEEEDDDDKLILIVEQQRFSIWKIIMLVIQLLLESNEEITGEKLVVHLGTKPPEQNGGSALAELLAARDGKADEEESWNNFVEEVAKIGSLPQAEFIKAVMVAYEQNSFEKVSLRRKGVEKKGGFFAKLAGRLANNSFGQKKSNLSLAA